MLCYVSMIDFCGLKWFSRGCDSCILCFVILSTVSVVVVVLFKSFVSIQIPCIELSNRVYPSDDF